MKRHPGTYNTDIYGLQGETLTPCLLEWTGAQAADLDADGLLVEHETSATLATTATTFAHTLPCPRQLTAIVKSADATEVTADSTITFYGTNIADAAISETLTFTADLATELKTTKAFKTVTSIVFSAQADGTPAFNIGWNEVIGLPFMLAAKPFYLEQFGGAMQFTAGTMTVDNDEIEKNTYDPNGNLDGTNALSLLLFL